MATVYGLTTSGFVAMPATVVKQEWDASMRAEFGAGFNMEAETPEGQFVGIAVEREAIIWEAIEAVANATGNPAGSSGAFLENLASLTGAVRLSSTKSSVTLTCTGTTGTVLSMGRTASVLVAGSRFVTTASATIAAVSAWANGTAYALAARRTNGGNVYQCTQAGTSGATGPTGTDPEVEVSDGTCKWRYLGAGTGAVDVAAASEDYGAVSGPARSITVIESPVGGWSNVINVLDAALGRGEETDAAFRRRRQILLRAQGLAAVDAVRAAVLDVDGVESVTVFENVTSAVDVDGRPPKSIEAMVEGGTDAAVGAAVWASKPGGIETHGTTTQAVTDSRGGSRSVKFTRPTDVDIYVTISGTKDPATYPLDGDDQIKAAVAAWGDDHHPIGKDVVSSSLTPPVWQIPGVVDAPSPKIGTAPSPSATTTVVVGSRSRARFDTSRIVVTMIDAVDA